MDPAVTGEPDVVSRRELGRATVSGIRWVGAARVAAEALGFCAAVALARLVSPAAFGHAAIVLIMGQVATILTFEGFGSVLVQRATITVQHVGSAVVMSWLTGLLLSLFTLLVLPDLLTPVFGSETASLFRLISPVFLCGGLGCVPRATLQRRLAFKTIAVTEVASLVGGWALSVALAADGLEAKALVIGALCASVLQAGLLFAAAPSKRLRVHLKAMREIVSFGGPASLAGVTEVGRQNADYAMLAAQLAAGQVGIYWRARQLGVEYQDKISGIMLRLVFPLYCRSNDVQTMREMRERITRLHAVVIFPCLSLLIILAPVLVPLVFGPKWTEAVVPTQILAGAGMCTAVLTGYPQLMYAAGRPRRLLVYNVLSLTAFVVIVALAAPYGIKAVAIADVGFYVVMLLTVQVFLVGPVLNIPLRSIVGELGPAFGASVVLLATGMPAFLVLRDAHAARVVLLLLPALVGIPTALVVLRFCFRAAWDDVALVATRLLPQVDSKRLGQRASLGHEGNAPDSMGPDSTGPDSTGPDSMGSETMGPKSLKPEHEVDTPRVAPAEPVQGTWAG
jgi:PST family polysaccharide transporter